MRLGEISEDQIECLICHKRMRHVSSHLVAHKVTVAEYKERFPGVVLCSQSITEERRQSNTGLKRSKEVCALISEKKTGQKYKPRSPEHCKKLSDFQKGRECTWGDKIRDGVNRFLESPEGIQQRKTHSEHLKQLYVDHPEVFENFIAAGRDNIKWCDTEPELQMRAILNQLGLECEPQGRIAELGGTHGRHPWDFLLRDLKIAIEADGCFFHLCPECSFPVRNAEMERSLVENERRGLERDIEADLSGWMVLRFWGHELAERPGEIAGCVMEAVEHQRRMVA